MFPRSLNGYHWIVYHSNPNPVLGEFFRIELMLNTPVLFAPETEGGDGPGSGPRWRDWRKYFAIDVNKDGKDDLVNLITSSWIDYGVPVIGVTNVRSRWQIINYLKNGSSFVQVYDSGENNNHSDNGKPMIPISSGQNRNHINHDLVLVQEGEYNYTWNGIYFLKFNKNISNENHLKKVIQSNGAIIDEIFYKTFDVNNTDYTPDYSANYPNVNINKIPTLNLIHYVKNTSLGTDKYQAFKYYGYMVNYSGLGSLGFQKTSRSSWYKQDSPKITWSVSENDPLKRGALTRTYLKLMNRHDVFVFNNYNNLLSKNENEYNPPSPPNTFPYVLTLDKQTSTDYLTNVKTEKSFKYSTDGFYLPTETTTKNYLDTNLQGTVVSKTEFYPNSFGAGNNYYIGRPDISKTITTAYGDTKSSSTKLTYSGSNVTQIEKRVGTDEASLATATEKIIETMTYAPNGNLLSKTILPTGFPATAPPIAARTTSFTYDTTNRFVKTSTDVEGLITTNNSYHPLYGTVTSQTNPFGQTTTSIYDNWGKPQSITDFLGKSITYQYTRSNNLFETKQIGSDGSLSGNKSDALGRVFIKSNKDLMGNINEVKTDYDWKGQTIKVSEPFLTGTSPGYFTTSEYDDYGRTTKTTAHTGQITTYSYNGLTTTVYDGKITNTTVKNANGHTVSTTELADSSTPNTINYTYDANGNLLTSNYGGIGMTMVYDLWGRKMKLIDPAAGTTTYKYNGYGEMLEEINPKLAKTTLTYNAVGKPLTKVEISLVVADATNISTVYDYDSTRKWLTSMVVTDPYGGNSNYSYSYDTTGLKPTFQLKETIENQVTLGAKFTKTLSFDDFGRPLTETNKAEMGGKTSTKTTFNVYANGVLKEIKDTNATGASIWKTETVNARGQLTKGVFGNGINDLRGYAVGFIYSIKQFNPNNSLKPAVDNTYGFEIYGNLLERFNKIFDTREWFYYDSNDRLNYWYEDFSKIQDCKFDNSVEGFTITGDGYLASTNGKLAATSTKTNTIVEKKIITNVGLQKFYSLKFDYTTFNSGCNIPAGVPYGCNNANLWYQIYEKNLTTQAITLLVDRQLTEHTSIAQEVQSNLYEELNPSGNSDIFIKFYTTLINPTYYGNLNYTIDNFVVNDITIKTQNYDNRGRITDNELGGYGYPTTGKIYQNNRVKLLPEAQPYYLVDRSMQTITYNAYKCPVDITETGKERISFGYNAMHDRSAMYYGSAVTNKLTRPFRKFYSADGSMEIKYTLATNSYEFATYLGGDAYSAPAVVKSDGTTQNTFYLHRDNQNSILAVSNAAGTVIERRLFDAWGQLAKFEKNGVEVAISSLNATNGIFLDRGYTGHEHLLGVGLINMNARLYDPKLRRFLQTDNEVQDPTDAQNYNRYGYCLNNPLKYVDPSGNDPILIGILISVFVYSATTLSNGDDLTFSGLFQAAVIGGFTSVATFGIGDLTSTIGNFFLRSTVQSAAHGLFNGGMAHIQGGNFWNGAAAGSLSSIASSVWSGGTTERFGSNGSFSSTTYHGIAGSSGASMIAYGAISGGVGASLTGGNFWKGAVTGLVVSGLNHALHDSPNQKLIRKLNRELKTLKGRPTPGQADVNKVGNLGTMKSIAGKSGNPELWYIDIETGPKSARGHFTTVAEDNDPTTIQSVTDFSKGSHINVYNNSFDSWSDLAETILHEYGHAYSRYNGIFMNGYKAMGNNLYAAYQVDEVFAWQYQTNFGFSMFQNGGGKKFYATGLDTALQNLGLKSQW